jgi:hypothetical protein
MEPLYIDFSDSVSLSGKLKFLGILMSIIGLAGTTICIISKTFGITFYINLFWLFYGIAMLTPYPYRISTMNKPFFKVDEESVEFRTTPFSFPKKEDWQNITGITIKLQSLYLDTKDGKKKKINLNWISSRNALLIKQTMRDFAASKNLEVHLINV